jgi:lipoprotein signal peptidase
VIDWIKLPYFPPTFNLADSAITIGAAVIVLASVRGWRLDGDSSRPNLTTQQAPLLNS